MLKNILSRMVLETTYVAKFASMTTVAAIAVVLFAQTAHAQDLPPSPTGQCKFNWNIWTSAITQAQTLVPESENPTTYGGTKINTSLGTDMWYSPPGGVPNFAYTEVNDGGKPADIPSFTTEFIYGIGRFVSITNESRTVTITDSGAYEGHALAVFDSGGHQIARYPDAATVTNQGKYYIKSGGNGGPDAEGVQKPGSWSDTFTFTVPADGEYYLHYIIIDSGYAYNSITSSLCKTTPLSATDDSFGPISAGIGASTTNVVANDELNNVANPDIGTEVMDVSINSAGNATDGSVLGLDITPTVGSITMDRGTGQIVVAPNTTPGNYVFTYEICEVLNPENCATARATLGIVVQPIVATNDTMENSVLGTSTTVSALANDTDAEGARDAGAVTLTTTGKPANAVLSGDGKTLTVPGEGEWSVDSGTGNVTFIPAAGYDGDPTVYYAVSDIFGNASNEASITIDYGDRPVVVDDTLENTSATIAAVTFDPEPNHTDADGSLDVTTVVLTGTGAPADAVLSVDGKTLTVPGEGEWSVDASTAEITFTPEDGFAGDPTPATYTIADNDGNVSAEASLAIDYGDRPVVVDENPVSATIEAVTFDPLANNSDADGSLDVTTVVLTGTGAPADAVLSVDGKMLTVPGEGQWSVDANTGEITFTPEDGFAGDPTPAAYTIADNDGNVSAEASLAIDYGDRPVVVDDTLENTSATIAAVTFDPEPNHTDADGSLDLTTVVLIGTGAPADAVLSVDGKTLTVPGEGEWSVDANTGEITFTPEDGFAGDPTPAAYTIADNDGNVSAEASLAIDYGDRPVAVADSHFSPMAVGVSVDPLINDSDTDGSLDATTVVLTKTGASADASLSVDGKTLIVPGEGEWRVDPATGVISFAPESGVTNDPTPASYRVSDNTGNASNEAILTVDYGDGLIAPIKEDLKTILTQDLTNTLIQQSTQIGSYSSDALSRVQNMSQNGCLLAVRETLEQTKILFDVGGAEIKPESQGVLDDLASVFANCPNTGFEIAGHTDSDASDAYNLALSQGRAEAVIDALKARGVDTSGFIAHGYGEANPIASNSTPDGKKQNRRIEVRVLGPDGSDAGCESSYELDRSFKAAVDEKGASMDGTFIQDNFDCQSQRRSLVEGAISYTDTDGGLEQSAMTLSYRREQYRNGNSVFGYFGGIYGTQSDVKERATGDIQGVGVNAGIYGVDRLNSGLYLDYHLAGAMGRHSFDLTFDRDFGAVNGKGEYEYMAAFAGAAVSGRVTLNHTTLTPRIGFSYSQTSGANVNVKAAFDDQAEDGNFKLDSISGGRLFAEVRSERSVMDGAANLWITPRVTCYQSMGTLDQHCGYGGSIGLKSANENSELKYSVILDKEWGQNHTRSSLSVNIQRNVGSGSVSGEIGVTRNAHAVLGATYEIRF